MTTDTYEFAKSYLADLMVMNPRISKYNAYRELKEAGFVKGTKPYSQRAVAEMMDEIRNEWADEQLEERKEARRRQLREIQFIKARLHQQGDYKTLERYLRIEKDLLGTGVVEEREDRKAQLEAAAYIAALEKAREEEELILGNKSTIEEADYLDVIKEA